MESLPTIRKFEIKAFKSTGKLIETFIVESISPSRALKQFLKTNDKTIMPENSTSFTVKENDETVISSTPTVTSMKRPVQGRETMIEKPADGVKGFFLYNMFEDKYWFRVYKEDKTYTDYRMTAEDIEVIIHPDAGVAFYEDPENPERNMLDWSSKTLGR